MDQLRSKINEVDEKLVLLLGERRNLSKEVIKAKDLDNLPVRDMKRESELLNRIIDAGKTQGLDTHYVTKVFHEVIEDSVRLQQNFLLNKSNKPLEERSSIRIAIQGIEGAYSFLAANKFFAHSDEELEFVSKHRFEEVVRAVEKGEADYAMLPIENTTSGGINEVYDLLLHTTLSIIGEEIFHVKHCLVGTEEISLNKITKVYAHYQAAAQCSKFLDSLPNCKVEFFADTAMSVQKIKEVGDSHFAAISSEEAANLFDVPILKKNIANQTENFTRFLVVSRNPVKVDERIKSKTSLVLATEHSPGSLVRALMSFQTYGLNMTKLESRPILGNPFEEMFYLDFEGNVEDENVLMMLDELKRHTRFFKILGTYPEQELVSAKPAIKKYTPEELKISKENIASKDEKDSPTGVKKTKAKSYKLASRDFKPEDTIIKVKDIVIGGDTFVVMAGPCSVESENQIFSCAQEVKNNGAHILRGGCFKPRTSPYSFQGLGNEGLKMMSEAGKSFDLPIITEILSIDQIQDVVKYSDMLQIGARNMQNFSLLKEVGKTHKPILLKRGMMSSISELLNAAEHIMSQGNQQVILCERGIRTFETATRNTLDLSAVLVIKELSHLPVIVDPSHAVGFRDKVIPLAKAAKVVGAHGVMVEFHPEPEKALSDGEQSLYFYQFEEMMKELNSI
ncbi:MAG: bifunctional 3-deoxy-7-phosphoheptulonate synthase/chorismate mutase [Bacteroidetes bacterium]|nr:bifunctional 3-deoxy-7-phosphoheptulonate synthase/chorismate mutase [Bacteroidota bacterium]